MRVNKIFRSFFYVVINLFLELSVILFFSLFNNSSNDSTIVLSNFESTLQIALTLILFTILSPIVLSLINNFKSIVFFFKIPIEIIMLYICMLNNNDSAMWLYSFLFMIVLIIFRSLISFLISVIVIKIKNK